MVTVDTVEGWIDDGRVTWHYDVFAGVMYVRIEADAETPALGEMNDAGNVIDRRCETSGRLIGRTAIGWKAAGVPGLPDSTSALGRWAESIAVGL